MTAPRAREQRRPPSPPEHPPSRRGGHSPPYAVSAAGRPAGFARLAGARRALSRSARAVAVVACLCLAGAFALPTVQADTTDNGPHGSEHTHFYLWRTTMTVGEASGYLGYIKSNVESWGELSHGATFNYPPWSPPHKHHFDPDDKITVNGIYIEPEGDKKVLQLNLSTAVDSNVTLWIRNTPFPLGGPRAFSRRRTHFAPKPPCAATSPPRCSRAGTACATSRSPPATCSTCTSPSDGSSAFSTERSRATAYRAIRAEITRLVCEARQLPVLVIDEAQHLRNDVLEDLRLLTNFAMDAEHRLCLLLVGLTELRRRLAMAVHESLTQRLVVRHHLPGLERRTRRLPHPSSRSPRPRGAPSGA